MNAEQARVAVIDAILHGERTLAAGLLDEYALSHGYRTAMSEVMEPGGLRSTEQRQMMEERP